MGQGHHLPLRSDSRLQSASLPRQWCFMTNRGSELFIDDRDRIGVFKAKKINNKGQKIT